VLLLGLLQSLFESAMYTFVFMWSPALNALKDADGGPLPFGMIFASFMVRQLSLSLSPLFLYLSFQHVDLCILGEAE
jgi:hypothetical protein